MTAAVLGLGTALQVSDGASPEVYTTIAEVLSLSGPELTAEDIEVTNLDSTAKEYISGVPDGGSASFELNWISSAQQETLRDDVEAGTARNYKIVFSTSPNTTASFNARCTEFSMTSDPNTQIRASATLKISGSVTWVN
jgi:hypothetical protein